MSPAIVLGTHAHVYLRDEDVNLSQNVLVLGLGCQYFCSLLGADLGGGVVDLREDRFKVVTYHHERET